jgi:hypothetical protein
MNESCEKCRFYSTLNEDAGLLFGGYCRKSPPVLVSGPDATGSGSRWEQPVVAEGDWCGEFQQRGS